MPITREQADSIVMRLRLPFYDDNDREVGDLNLTSRPNLLSRDEFRRMQAIAEGDESDQDDNGLAPLLSRCLVGWDFLQDPFTDGEGNVRPGDPYPITPDSLGILGYPVQLQIVREMIGGPNRQSGTKHGRGSAERRILPPIESSTSSRPDIGESMRPV